MSANDSERASSNSSNNGGVKIGPSKGIRDQTAFPTNSWQSKDTAEVAHEAMIDDRNCKRTRTGSVKKSLGEDVKEVSFA
jgi:hypothetical protein